MSRKDLKKYYLVSIITLILTIILTITINYSYYKKIEKNNNYLLSTIFNNIKQEYPELDDLTIIHLLNTNKFEKYPALEQYGILIEKNNISLSNKYIMDKCLISVLLIIIMYILISFLLLYLSNRKQNKNIIEITSYLKEINKHNYKLEIDSNEEGELSILKNELYKTAIMLNEQAIQNKKAKESLKDSLSDISHQLRTPLTSINLMIDNLLEENLSKPDQRKLLISINRKIKSTNFLIESLLKLSKFDANTIEFNNKNYKINKILKSVENNLTYLLDLNDITLIIEGNNKDTLYCDYHWQIEALTNIIKNCIEHSNPGSKINIKYSKTDILTKIIITDHGSGMNDKDKKHLFDRFYKGENSNPDSIGIGMSLAKTIIENNNGNINVSSKIGQGTIITIKYLR